MSYGFGSQTDNSLRKKRGQARCSHKWAKKSKHRTERRRVKADIDCAPAYRKYSGYES